MYGGQTVNLFFRTTASFVSLLRSGKLWFLMRYTVAVLVLFLVSAFGARLCATALFGSWSPRSRTGSGCLWGLAGEQFHGARFYRRSWEGNALFRWSSAPSTGHGERTLGEIILLVSSSTHATQQRGIASSTPVKRFPLKSQSLERSFFLLLMAMKNVHSETCSLPVRQYIRDPSEWEGLFNAILPAVHEKAMSAILAASQENSFAERVVALAAVKGVFSSTGRAAGHQPRDCRGRAVSRCSSA